MVLFPTISVATFFSAAALLLLPSSAVALSGRVLVFPPLATSQFELVDLDHPVHVNLDWSYEGQGETGDAALVDGSGEEDSEMLLVRYNVDGIPAKTTAWGGPSGAATVPLNRLGNFSLSVTVCDHVECTESEPPLTVSVGDGSNGLANESWKKPSDNDEEHDEEVRGLQHETRAVAVQLLNDVPKRGLRGTAATTRKQHGRRMMMGVGATLALALGKAIMTEVGKRGTSALLDAIIGPDPVDEKLDEILDSLKYVKSKLEEVGSKIEKVSAIRKCFLRLFPSAEFLMLAHLCYIYSLPSFTPSLCLLPLTAAP